VTGDGFGRFIYQYQELTPFPHFNRCLVFEAPQSKRWFVLFSSLRGRRRRPQAFIAWGSVERKYTKTALAAVNGGEIAISSLLVRVLGILGEKQKKAGRKQDRHQHILYGAGF